MAKLAWEKELASSEISELRKVDISIVMEMEDQLLIEWLKTQISDQSDNFWTSKPPVMITYNFLPEALTTARFLTKWLLKRRKSKSIQRLLLEHGRGSEALGEIFSKREAWQEEALLKNPDVGPKQWMINDGFLTEEDVQSILKKGSLRSRHALLSNPHLDPVWAAMNLFRQDFWKDLDLHPSEEAYCWQWILQNHSLFFHDYEISYQDEFVPMVLSRIAKGATNAGLLVDSLMALLREDLACSLSGSGDFLLRSVCEFIQNTEEGNGYYRNGLLNGLIYHACRLDARRFPAKRESSDTLREILTKTEDEFGIIHACVFRWHKSRVLLGDMTEVIDAWKQSTDAFNLYRENNLEAIWKSWVSGIDRLWDIDLLQSLCLNDLVSDSDCDLVFNLLRPDYAEKRRCDLADYLSNEQYKSFRVKFEIEEAKWRSKNRHWIEGRKLPPRIASRITDPDYSIWLASQVKLSDCSTKNSIRDLGRNLESIRSDLLQIEQKLPNEESSGQPVGLAELQQELLKLKDAIFENKANQSEDLEWLVTQIRDLQRKLDTGEGILSASQRGLVAKLLKLILGR